MAFELIQIKGPIPLRDSILSDPSSLSQVLLVRLSELLTSGLYSHPVFRSGIHLLEEADSEEFFSQPYWWPTTVPTNQVLEAELKIKSFNLNLRF